MTLLDVYWNDLRKTLKDHKNKKKGKLTLEFSSSGLGLLSYINSVQNTEHVQY